MRGPKALRRVAISLIAGGIVILTLPLLIMGYAWLGQARLQASAPHWQRRSPAAGPAAALAAATYAQPAAGSEAAILQVPRLGLNLAVLQGTSDAILAVAPGHEPQSVMPGEPGTAVIVAHNLTFFRNLDLLQAGDAVTVRDTAGTFTFRVTGHRIVPAQASLPNTPQASLALIACYPLNALYLTPQRYVVFATLTRPAAQRKTQAARPASLPMAFQATLPPDLQRVPLWLSDTHLTVSTANFTGGSSIPLTASGGSWSLVAQSIRMFAGTLRALSGGAHPALAGFGPSPELIGFPPGSYFAIRPDAAVEITAALLADGRPETVTVSLPYATLEAGPSRRSGSYTATLGVAGSRLYLVSVRWGD